MLLELSKQFTLDISQLRKDNIKLPTKVWDLIFSILQSSNNPIDGIGKPEALKGNLSGYYSREITNKHRLIYKFDKGVLILVSCFGHYDDK